MLKMNITEWNNPSNRLCTSCTINQLTMLTAIPLIYPIYNYFLDFLRSDLSWWIKCMNICHNIKYHELLRSFNIYNPWTTAGIINYWYHELLISWTIVSWTIVFMNYCIYELLVLWNAGIMNWYHKLLVSRTIMLCPGTIKIEFGSAR